MDSYNAKDAIVTKGLQLTKGNRWYLSPVTLWEILLTTNLDKREQLIFFSQHLFYDYLLKSPAEICIDYIEQNCPPFQKYTDFYSTTDFAQIWTALCNDKQSTFWFDHQQLAEWTSHLKQVSKKADKIINGITVSLRLEKDEEKLFNLFNLIYQSLPNRSEVPTVIELQKLSIVFLFYYLCIGVDLTPEVIDAFWNKRGIDETIDRLYYLLQHYPELIQKGPFMEFALMARSQMKLKPKTGRGLLHDSLHCICLPFVGFLFTDDNHFIALRDLKIFNYHKKIKSIKNDVKLTEKLTRIE